MISVRRSILIAAGALLLAALLDAEALARTASSQPFGWKRDLALSATDPLLDVSRALRLTTPRHWLEDAFDRPSTRPDPAPAPPVTVPPKTSSPSTAPTTSTPSTSSDPTSPSTTLAPARRVPTPAEPLRLLIAGDSMTEAPGPALVGAADATGRIDARHELRYSSGLTRPDYFDWPSRLAALIAEHDAEAIVVMFGANDAQGIATAGGSASFGSDAWVEEYRRRVADVMTLLAAEGRTVYWIGQPIMRSSSFDQRMRLITDIYRDEARRHAGVRFNDIRALFSDPGGSYSAYLSGADGRPVLVRREDGIHLTAAGASRLTPVVMAAIQSDWELGPDR